MSVRATNDDEWELLRRIARRIHGTSQEAEVDVERMAGRMAAYVRSGQLRIAAAGEVLGTAVTSNVILDFDDGREPICIPLDRAQPPGPSAGTTSA